MRISSIYKRNRGNCKETFFYIHQINCEHDQVPYLSVSCRRLHAMSDENIHIELDFDEIKQLYRYMRFAMRVGVPCLVSGGIPSVDEMQLEDEPREICVGVAPIVNDGDSAPMQTFSE